jgi:hypothetical protein
MPQASNNKLYRLVVTCPTNDGNTKTYISIPCLYSQIKQAITNGLQKGSFLEIEEEVGGDSYIFPSYILKKCLMSIIEEK